MLLAVFLHLLLSLLPLTSSGFFNGMLAVSEPGAVSISFEFSFHFLQAFDFFGHSALFHKLISAGLPPWYAHWTQSFLSARRACVVYEKSQKSFLSSPSRCSARIRSWSCIFSLFIKGLPASLASSVSCSLCADDLEIWFSSILVATAVEVTQKALFQLERWSKYWCLSVNPNKCEPLSFQWIPIKLISSPTCSYPTPASVSMPLPIFSGSHSTALFPSLNMHLR